MTTWQLWLRVNLGHEAVLGALGEHACASSGRYLREVPFGDSVQRLDRPPKSGPRACVVAVDAPLIVAEPAIVRRIPAGAGCVLVVPQETTDGEIAAARAALGSRPGWVALAHSAISAAPPRDTPWGRVVHEAETVARFLPIALQWHARLARAGARHRGAVIGVRLFSGVDNTASHWIDDLEGVLDYRFRDPEQDGWRRRRARSFVCILNQWCPPFRTLITALSTRANGRRRTDFEVVSNEDPTGWASGRSFWQTIHLEWLTLNPAAAHASDGPRSGAADAVKGSAA
jgi:hypothetical protein